MWLCDYLSISSLYKIVMSYNDPLPCWTWKNKLTCCELPYGGGHLANSWGSPPTNSQQEKGPSHWQGHYCYQQSCKLGKGCFPSWLSGENLALVDTLIWALAKPCKPCLDSWPSKKKPEGMIMCFFVVVVFFLKKWLLGSFFFFLMLSFFFFNFYLFIYF